jgi:hypothetical protein
MSPLSCLILPGGLPAGAVMAANADGALASAGWTSAGFAGFVTGYLLVFFIPEERKSAQAERSAAQAEQAAHAETLKHIASEFNAATKAAVDGNLAAFHETGNRICLSVESLRDSLLKAYIDGRTAGGGQPWPDPVKASSPSPIGRTSWPGAIGRGSCSSSSKRCGS